jgi:transposase, IS30 family
VRQYFPKGTEFTDITPERVLEVQEILNNRPRKRFGYHTPNEVLSQALLNNGRVAFMS